MSEPVFKPRLPTFGSQDGDQVITSSGNVYEYNAELNEWVCIGILPDPDVVNSSDDGLVSPDLYRKLSLIQELIERGFDFSNFKLNTDLDQEPYFYYFYSSDDLVKFTPQKVVEPKEVIARPTVAQVVDRGDGTTSVLFVNAYTTSFDGYILETDYGNYPIISSTNNSVVLNSSSVNILPGDFVKVVQEEAVVTQLRIEVDRGRLYQKLVRNCCIGPKGLKGAKGDTGTDGVAADDEVFQIPVVSTGNVFSWSLIVETPIDTPISLRVFRSVEEDNAIIEVLHSIDNDGTVLAINDTTISINESSVSANYDSESKLFTGSFDVDGDDDISLWRFKARQRGAKGASGSDGKSFLQVVTQLLDDPNIRSTNAILSMRKSAASNDIIVLTNSLFTEVPVSNLSAVAGRIDNIEEDRFVSVASTIEEAKNIGFYQVDFEEFITPDLDIPLWTPTSDCVQARRWGQYRFDWFNQIESNDLFSIVEPPRPPEQCCQEDFFFCPNVGDNPCGVQGTVNPPSLTPVDEFCNCINPIANDLIAGGYTFNPIDLTDGSGLTAEVTEEDLEVNIVGSGGNDSLLSLDDIQASAVNSVESIIDGIENNFTQDIKLVGNGEIIVMLDFDPDPCGGPSEERSSCVFVDSNAVRSMFTLVDRSGTATISNGGLLESQTIPTSVAFTVQGQSRTVPAATSTAASADCDFSISADASIGGPGDQVTVGDSVEYDVADLQLKMSINTTNVSYCRGYRLTIIAMSDQDSALVVGTVTVTSLGDPVDVVNNVPNSSGEVVVEPVAIVEDSSAQVVPEDSFAPDGTIIENGTITDINNAIDTLTLNGNYAIHFGISRLDISGTGYNNIFLSFLDLDIGVLKKAPSDLQTPLIFDGAQNNNILSIDQSALSKVDAAYDVDGPWGIGTYILGLDLTTRWSSRIPNTLMRHDTWTDVIGYFNEPQDGEDFRFFAIGRLSSSTLYDHADSVFVDELFNNQVADGIIVIDGVLSGDPMEAINSGEIVLAEQGTVAVIYQQDGLDDVYPDIVIDGIGTGEDVEIIDSGIDNIVISPTSLSADASFVDYTFLYETTSSIPDDGQIWFTFPTGFDVSGVNLALSGTYSGGFDIEIMDQIVKLIRHSGSPAPAGAYDITIGPVKNGSAGSYEWVISTRDFGDVLIDGPETSGEIDFS